MWYAGVAGDSCNYPAKLQVNSQPISDSRQWHDLQIAAGGMYRHMVRFMPAVGVWVKRAVDQKGTYFAVASEEISSLYTSLVLTDRSLDVHVIAHIQHLNRHGHWAIQLAILRRSLMNLRARGHDRQIRIAPSVEKAVNDQQTALTCSQAWYVLPSLGWTSYLALWQNQPIISIAG